MIRINLLQQKEAKRQERGLQVIMFGLLAVLFSGIGVYFFVHQPLVDELDRQERTNKKIAKDNKKIEQRTANFEEIAAAVEQEEERLAAIERLNHARSAPCWLMHELSTILNRDGVPTMTDEMAERVADNKNLQWSKVWDPQHVWINSFDEKNGSFRLTGSAQSDGDMTQLALRLDASAYFENVQIGGGDVAANKSSGLSYYNFTITGKVRY